MSCIIIDIVASFLIPEGVSVLIIVRRRSAMLLILTLMVSLIASPVQSVTPTGTFQPDSCMFELPSGAVEGRDLECGWLQVPERHERPDGPVIRLAVAIIKSRAVDRKPDPLVMLQGGPGGSTIDTYTRTLFAPGNRLRDLLDRDIVLMQESR